MQEFEPKEPTTDEIAALHREADYVVLGDDERAAIRRGQMAMVPKGKRGFLGVHIAKNPDGIFVRDPDGTFVNGNDPRFDVFNGGPPWGTPPDMPQPPSPPTEH